MRIKARKAINVLAASMAMVGCLAIDVKWSPDVRLASPAEARVGRPLTPMSYAGVARRTTRRAVVYGGAAAAAAAGAYVATPGCAQVTDAYGRVYNQC